MIDGSKETMSSGHKKTDAHMSLQTLWQNSQDLYRFKSEGSQHLERENEHGVPPQTKKICAMGTH